MVLKVTTIAIYVTGFVKIDWIVLKCYIVQSEDGFSHKSLLLYVILALYQCK